MINETVSIDDVIKFLNDLLKLDYDLMYEFVMNRKKCNDKVAGHETIQVQLNAGDENLTVGLIGLLNGIFGKDEEGWGPIACVIEDDGKISGFERTPATKDKI
jgi:hypothetical protein